MVLQCYFGINVLVYEGAFYANPLLAEGFLAVAQDIARGTETCALKVKGDSMVEDGILEGDYVVIRRQERAENGDIVCALIGDEATLKRFFRHGDQVALKPPTEIMNP